MSPDSEWGLHNWCRELMRKLCRFSNEIFSSYRWCWKSSKYVSTMEIPGNVGVVWFYHAPWIIISNSGQFWASATFFFIVWIEFEEHKALATNNQTNHETKQTIDLMLFCRHVLVLALLLCQKSKALLESFNMQPKFQTWFLIFRSAISVGRRCSSGPEI